MGETIDEMRLLYDFAGDASKAGSVADLEAVWRQRVRPVYAQLSDDTLGIITRLYCLKVSILVQAHDRAA